MNSRERIKMALDHREADHVPFDLGGTAMTTIHMSAYANLRRYLDLPDHEPTVAFVAEQLAAIDEDLAERLETDVRLVSPQPATGFRLVFRDAGDYEAYTDEWGIGWRMPRQGGFYYDMYFHPLGEAQGLQDLREFKFPDPLDDRRFENLRRTAQAMADKGKFVALGSVSPGILEVYSWVRGYEQFFTDLALEQQWVAYWLDRMVEFKCAYWQRALAEVGDLVDMVIEADDLGGQKSLLLSPQVYRSVVKPRHARLLSFIKQQAPVKVFFHSCGAIRPLIGDLIDAGIDVLNPVQINALGGSAKELKREFGRDLVFWGGGVDTQRVLGFGSPEEVRADVEHNIEALAPGGGYVFAAVHDIQANVPPQNIIAMWESWKAHGTY
jgi:uroporphyrinogen decarboxylase